MDAIETAIRNALARGDADDRGHRERVYRSVFAALEKSIAENPQLTPEQATRRREALKHRITEIEKEFVPAAPAIDPDLEPDPLAADEIRSPVADDGPHARYRDEVAPQVDTRRERMQPEPADRDAAAMNIEGESRSGDYGNFKRPRGRWARLFIAATVVAIIAIGIVWTWQTGMFDASDGSVPNPPQIEEEDFDPGPSGPPLGPGNADLSRDWITVFTPGNPASIIAPPGTQAEVREDDDGVAVLRIGSGGGAPVLFDVGEGILERLAGRTAVFNIVARAEEGQETQISVSCDFRDFGDCGRRRYIVGTHRADYLFEVELPSGRPGGAGQIEIISDVEDGGKAIEVYEIRVATAD